MVEEFLERLKCFDSSDFKFDPVEHKYTYLGERFISVTQFIGQFHTPFETDKWSKIKAEQAGVDQEDILKEWKRLNDYANEIGTATHQWAEDYYNKIWREIPTNQDLLHRITKFNKIYSTHLYKLTPLAFEVRVFSEKWRIAGMIDALFIFKGKIYILDYKTNKDFTTDEHRKGKYEKLLYPFDEYWKNHLNEYSIQLSLYACILEEYGFEIGGCYLVYIGPDQDDAKMHKCVDMRYILKSYIGKSY